MKYSNYNYDDIKHTIKFYTENCEYKSLLVPYPNISEDEFIKLLIKRQTKSKELDKIFYHSLVTIRNNKDLINNETLETVNKLIGDHKIMNKIRYIYDGSFYSARIYDPKIVDDKFSFIVDIDARVLPEYINNLKPAKKIDWLYNHLDYIPVQLPFMHLQNRMMLLYQTELNKLKEGEIKS